MTINGLISRTLKKLPLPLVLIGPFVIIILIAVGFTISVVLYNQEKTTNERIDQLRQEITAHIHGILLDHLETPHLVNQINTDAIQLGLLDLDNPEQLEPYLWNQLQQFETISLVAIGTTEGEYLEAQRTAEGAINLGRSGPATGGELQIWAAEAGQRSRLLQTSPAYDPRARPWYKIALDAGGPAWTDAYPYVSNQTLAISANRPIYDRQGNLLGVASADLTLVDIQETLQEVEIGHSGEVFIMERSGLLIASSIPQPIFIKKAGSYQRCLAAESDEPLIRTATRQLLEQFGSLAAINRAHQLSFTLDNDKMYAQVTPLRDERGLDWLTVVIIPKNGFVAQFYANRRSILILIFGAWGLAILSGVGVSQWIIRPLIILNRVAGEFARGNWTAGQNLHTDRVDELGQLARSFQQMAHKLQNSFDALEQANESLEQRVHDRTEQLSETNALLKQEKKALRSSEERYRTLFERAQDVIILENGREEILDANSAATRLFGYPYKELLGMKSSALLRPTEQTFPIYSHTQSFDMTIEMMAQHRNGSQTPIELTVASFHEGEETFFLSIIRDISERKRIEEELRKLSRAVEQSANAVVITDLAGKIEFVNPAFCQKTGYTFEEAIGENPRILKSGKHSGALYQDMWGTISRGEVWKGELINRRKDGSFYWEYATISPIKDKEGYTTHYLAIKEDITERKEAEEKLKQAYQELERLAHLDGLTELANRRRFDRYLSVAWAETASRQQPLSLILSDIDYFKKYNDAYGHLMGDDCLQQVARAIERAIRQPDSLAARYGGEEFAVVLPDVDLEEAHQTARLIQRNVRALQIPHSESKVSDSVTVSLGVATIIPTSQQSSEKLVLAADKALYEAKEQGRNRIVLKQLKLTF